jgi:DNA-binding NarL/FixJ family response regulator
MSLIRVLVVDDFSAWQDFTVQQLEQQSDVCVVGLASDGLEAVQKAEQLQPDLILLDVGLRTLNGIEAARQIRKCVPEARILFLSSNSDDDVVRGALCAGGDGYVLKQDAGAALAPAMEAVLRGEQFVSSSLMAVDSLPDLQK